MIGINEVIYDEVHWSLFEKIRKEANELMRPLAENHIRAIAYGSIARGDISETSDVDIFIPKPPPPAIIESLAERAGHEITIREIVQATPTYAAKGYIYFDEKRSYSFPLVDLRTIELEFYSFAGSTTVKQTEKGERVIGVDKRLMFIEPTQEGHLESLVQGREGTVAKRLGISVSVVLDRVRTINRRKRVGRTGVYLKHPLGPGESFGEAFRKLSRRRPALRRRLRM
jgi:predicted nucleotidyltransferase